MKKFIWKCAGLSLAAIFLFSAGCAAQPAVPTASPTAAASPVPSATPAPAFTPTPSVFAPPAKQYLPGAARLGPDYEAEGSLLSENMAAQAPLPVPPDAMAAISFRNNSSTARATDPQNGLYYRLSYWVVLAESEANARFLYGISQSPQYAKNAFLMVMPAAIHETMGDPAPLVMDKGRCEDLAVSTYVSDTYAAFHGNGPLPTVDPLSLTLGMTAGASAEELAVLPPDLFIYGACRVDNAIILFWGHAPDNYDGKNAPIPEDVIAGQVKEKFDVVIDTLK
jgi:hypothetical protein